jgi:hypothetical protein
MKEEVSKGFGIASLVVMVMFVPGVFICLMNKSIAGSLIWIAALMLAVQLLLAVISVCIMRSRLGLIALGIAVIWCVADAALILMLTGSAIPDYFGAMKVR